MPFDIPFLATRSFIHKVPIAPFSLKSVIDLRDRISAYRAGHTRGTLKEFAALCRAGGTEGLARDLNILGIEKW